MNAHPTLVSEIIPIAAHRRSRRRLLFGLIAAAVGGVGGGAAALALVFTADAATPTALTPLLAAEAPNFATEKNNGRGETPRSCSKSCAPSAVLRISGTYHALSNAGHHYVLRISLAGPRPEIWRRIRIAAELPLTAVHAAIQITMEWDAAHLYAFSFGADRYQASPLEEDELDEVELADVAKKGDRFNYVYDFGDNWRHEVLVEEVVIPGRASQPVLCLDGARAAPPEDCGGLPGYEALTSEGAEANGFRPERFDIESINVELTELFGVKDYQRSDFVDENGARLPTTYQPDSDLDEETWEELTTEQQLWSIAAYHYWLEGDEHPKIEILSAHALMHATVELHAASGSPREATEALARLLERGLSRHDAIHRLATALEEAMLGSEEAEPDAYKEAYVRSLSRLGTDRAPTKH